MWEYSLVYLYTPTPMWEYSLVNTEQRIYSLWVNLYTPTSICESTPLYTGILLLLYVRVLPCIPVYSYSYERVLPGIPVYSYSYVRVLPGIPVYSYSYVRVRPGIPVYSYFYLRVLPVIPVYSYSYVRVRTPWSPRSWSRCENSRTEFHCPNVSLSHNIQNRKKTWRT